jgi:hypothetical protein
MIGIWRIAGLLGVAAVAHGGVRESAGRTIALFEKAGAEWRVPCVSCHHQSLAMMALDSARRRGIAVNEAAAQAHVAKTLKPLLTSVDGALGAPLDAFSMGYGLIAAETAGVRPNLVTSVLARRFANAQHPDGRWTANDGRPPLSSSEFTATALAIRAISLYMPPQLAAERDRCFERARRWLRAAAPRSSEDRAYRLLGLLWAGAAIDNRRRAAKGLLSEQREDGGWAQESGMQSDAYATGQALYALRQSGALEASSAAFRRGLRFLLDTQRPDGSWLVKTRLHSPAPISPPFFDSGFPNGRDQYSSFAGSAWAVMGMLESLPEVAHPVKPEPPVGAEPKDAKPWMETALFGSVADLKTLLPAGLDGNVLPYVVDDSRKVELLLARGVKADARSLSIAASLRGSAPVLRLLIANGAKATPGVLRQAAMSGDTESVAVLLANGVDPNQKPEQGDSPLAAAAMMNHLDVVRLLARNGAHVDPRGEDGMTPLIVSALLHRTTMTRLLLELGADPNVVDRYGYTALRHTGDIAHAAPETAAALRLYLSARKPR